MMPVWTSTCSRTCCRLLLGATRVDCSTGLCIFAMYLAYSRMSMRLVTLPSCCTVLHCKAFTECSAQPICLPKSVVQGILCCPRSLVSLSPWEWGELTPGAIARHQQHRYRFPHAVNCRKLRAALFVSEALIGCIYIPDQGLQRAMVQWRCTFSHFGTPNGANRQHAGSLNRVSALW